MNIKPRQLAIIEAAGEVISKMGINGLTIKKLAEQMNFGESALYRHFKSKDEIILTMLQYLAENMEERQQLCLQNEMQPNEMILAFFQSQFDFFEEKPHFLVAVFSDGMVEENSAVNDALNRVMSVSRNFLTTAISKGKEQQLYSNSLPTDMMVHVFMGSYRLHMLKWRLSGYSFNLKEKGSDIIKGIIQLIQ